MKDSFKKDLHSADYYSILTSGSTDWRVLEPEVAFVFNLSDPESVVKFMTNETPDHTHSEDWRNQLRPHFRILG